MAGSTDAWHTSGYIPAERSSRARPFRKRGIPELTASVLETLHLVGFAFQKLPLGTWCLRQTDLLSIPTPIPHPVIPAYHFFAWIAFHLHPPFRAKFYPALKVQWITSGSLCFLRPQAPHKLEESVAFMTPFLCSWCAVCSQRHRGEPESLSHYQPAGVWKWGFLPREGAR